MKYSHIFWDFNGTVLDDLQISIDSVNTLLSRRGLDIIPGKDSYRKVFGFPIQNYYEKVGFDFVKESYHDVAVEWIEVYTENMVKATVNSGIPKALAYIKKLGIPQYILSATEHNMLNKQLDLLNIREYFEETSGLDNIYAGSKADLGRAVAKRLNVKKALFIGDTSHDYETALAMGADCVLFSGGHMDEARLKMCGCPVFDSFNSPEFLGFLSR